MPLLNLNLKNLGAVSECQTEAIVNKALREAITDVDDRGEDGKPRKVVIEITMIKEASGLIEVDVAAQAKLPPRRTHATHARPIRKDSADTAPGLYFEVWQANPDQKTLPVMDEDPSESPE